MPKWKMENVHTTARNEGGKGDGGEEKQKQKELK